MELRSLRLILLRYRA